VSFAGFIRIHMNLTRPISISLSRRLLTLSHSHSAASNDNNAADADADTATATDDDDDDDDAVKCVSFYLPHGTSKVIHVDRSVTYLLVCVFSFS